MNARLVTALEVSGLLGIASLVEGFREIYHPLGFIVAGIALLGIPIALFRRAAR